MKSVSILASIGGTALTAAIAAFIATSAIAPAPADASEVQAAAGSAALQPLTSQPCDSLVPPASTPRTVSYLTTNEVGITVCDPDGQGWAFNEATTGLSFVTNPGTVTSTLNYSATFASGPDASFDAISYAGANIYDMTTLQSYPATCSGDTGKVLQSGDTANLSCSIDIPVEALSSVYLTWQVAYDTIGADSTFRVTDGSFGPQFSFAVNAAPTDPTTPPVTTEPESPVVTPAPPVIAPPAAPAPVEKPKVTG